ncbi:MAG: hypothetical protein ACSHYF_02405 [Verrucomicrobiaceae bacterium]
MPDTADPPSPPPLPHGIEAPEVYVPGTPMWVWITLAIAALVIIIGLVYLARSLGKNATPPPPQLPSPYRTAEAKLTQLKDRSGELPIAEFASQVSLILRECLASVLKDPALYETDEEMATRLASLDRVPSGVRKYLITLGSAKYAPSSANQAQCHVLADHAFTCLREIETSQSPPPTP